MNSFALIFVISVCVKMGVVYGIQTTVLADLKQLEEGTVPRISNKVKRAQEVVMFGNQQNKLSEHNYVRADKRDITNFPVPDIQNNLDKDEIEEPIVMENVENPSYQQLAAALHARYYDRPDVYEMEAYQGRQKRNILNRLPLKKSDRVFRSYVDEGTRTKRESQISQLDPEELLSILRMLEAEQEHRKHSSDTNTGSRFEHSEYEPYSSDILNEIENDNGYESEDWLDGPISPSHRYIVKTRFYPPYNNKIIPNRSVRRYKNNPNNEYAQVLSQLSGNNGRLDQYGLLQRRYLL
ncbi:hypothetical protein PGB90_000604 [Kerria lacca]